MAFAAAARRAGLTAARATPSLSGGVAMGGAGGARRGMAGGVEHARKSVQKNKLVEQYNDLRENRFKTWKLNGGNTFVVLTLSLLLPAAWFFTFKKELKTNTRGNGRTGFRFIADQERF
mmetsp:Transcript_28253/g.66881  ORF Transcript_28253/g.66881 Transcript_28253/m.66881 type:complete len:119 (+) Transcript_28253:91-447(+)